MTEDKNEEQRLIKALKNLDELLQCVTWREPQLKNQGDSEVARRSGNEFYMSKNSHDVDSHLKALRYYTRSVALALPGSQELGLAYGNRSALLMHLGRYKESIQDIDRAVELPVDELRIVKYLCRKVECQVELGSQEAKDTCEIVQVLLQNAEASVDVKKSIVIKLVDAIVKLERKKKKNKTDEPLKNDNKTEIYRAEKFDQRSEECLEASSALQIKKANRNVRYGRHLTANRDILPGETLYFGEPYLSVPTRKCVHTHCSHCLTFAWAGIPCENCSQAIYCSENCKTEAKKIYHDVECKIIGRIWKMIESMNAGRIMSVRLLIKAVREAGGLRNLRDSLIEIDSSCCTDARKKGFSNDQRVFANNYASVYSLSTNVRKKTLDELESVSEDSAVLLYMLASHTRFFRNYFGDEKNELLKNDDALFVGKLLSHYQHIVIVNATTVKDSYNVSSMSWNWTVFREENSSGLYLNPFLSLLNHSCFPNVARCETKDNKTILYAIQPIGMDQQIFDCYGPMYSEMLKKHRVELLIKRFYFTCDCIACLEDWPIFVNTINNPITLNTTCTHEINNVSKALLKCDWIVESLKEKNFKSDTAVLDDLGFAIIMTLNYLKMPNWRLPSIISAFTSAFNDLYGYVVDLPDSC